MATPNYELNVLIDRIVSAALDLAGLRQEARELEKKLNEANEELRKYYEKKMAELKHTVAKETCSTSGHICPKSSPDYYYCERCGEYLG